MEQEHPVIVAFCCHYCAYTAADMAGSMRLNYPAEIKIIRVPCSGKVDPLYVMDALKEGADGVMVAGCLEGDCHFKNGNLKAAKRIKYLRGLLSELNLEEKRIEMVMVSAGMGKQFAKIVTEFEERIRNLGPNPLKCHEAPNSVVSEHV